jgi:hypothetical protein
MKGPSEEIRIGGIAVRFRLEGEASGGSVAVFEFDVAAGARVPCACQLTEGGRRRTPSLT